MMHVVLNGDTACVQDCPGVDYLIKVHPSYSSVASIPREDGDVKKKVRQGGRGEGGPSNYLYSFL